MSITAIRTKIESVLRGHFTTLVKDMDPDKAAGFLYESGVIDDSQHESATNRFVDRADRSQTLLTQLIRKLMSNPQWCTKAVVALQRAGVNVEAIVEDFNEAGIPVETIGWIIITPK